MTTQRKQRPERDSPPSSMGEPAPSSEVSKPSMTRRAMLQSAAAVTAVAGGSFALAREAQSGPAHAPGGDTSSTSSRGSSAGKDHGTKNEMARVRALQGQASVLTLSTMGLMTGGTPANDRFRAFVNRSYDGSQPLKGKSLAVMCTDGFEEVEVTLPARHFEALGCRVDIVSPKNKEFPRHFGVRAPPQRNTHVRGVQGMKNADWHAIDRFLEEVSVEDYDALLVPGGAWNPDLLRADPTALAFVRSFFSTGKPTCAICHGPLVFVSAGLVRGRKATSYWAVQIDLKNAGAQVIDDPVVVDKNLVTSRFPLDIPDLCDAIAGLIA